MPTGAGSGFVLSHHDKLFFVTADHVTHPDDYCELDRQWKDQDMVIVNNYNEKDENGVLTPICTPIGNFYYFEKGKFDEKGMTVNTKPFDATFCILTKDRFQKPFKNVPFIILNGDDVPGDLDMFPIPSKAIVKPDSSHSYFVYGNTQMCINPDDPSHLIWKPKLHEDLKLDGENGDYYVLKPTYPVLEEEWKGISGAPVLDNDGGLIGILCGGDIKTSEIFVMKMEHITNLMDYVIDIESHDKEKKG